MAVGCSGRVLLHVTSAVAGYSLLRKTVDTSAMAVLVGRDW